MASPSTPRVIALFAAYNERRFIRRFVENLVAQGLDGYMIDNESTDSTVAIAEAFVGRGLIGIEQHPRPGGLFSFRALLRRIEELLEELDADWYLLTAPDEFISSPYPGLRVRDALGEVGAAGYNAINLMGFNFIPTKEAPDHDHDGFRETMRHYYPFAPRAVHRLSCWRQQAEGVGLVESAGHHVDFPGLSMAPDFFPNRHYLFLSRVHAVEKYAGRVRVAEEETAGWGGWRNVVARSPYARDPSLVPLPSQDELRKEDTTGCLDSSKPLTSHLWAERWADALRGLDAKG